MAREIFISYSRHDLEMVREIKSEIERNTGIECWMDLNAIESGSPQFAQDIVTGIRECRVFLFMLSAKSQDSEFALRELNFASKKAKADRQKHVIIVNVDGCRMCDEFDFLYGLTDTIAWKSHPQKEKLLRDLKKWLGKETASTEFATGRESSQGENASAEYKTGWKFCHGEGVKRNYKEALEWYKRAAGHGHSEAMNELGLMYENCWGVLQDDVEAVKWYQIAGEHANANALFNLGRMYENGRGLLDRSYTKAVSCYSKASELGNAEAQNQLGWLYHIGIGVSRNYEEAVKWMTASANQGLVLAINNLGWIYRHGIGVPQDKKEAIRWFRKAALRDSEYAFSNLVDLGVDVSRYRKQRTLKQIT